MATTLRDDDREHSIVTDLLGAVLGVAAGLLLVAAAFAAGGMVLLRWADGIGG